MNAPIHTHRTCDCSSMQKSADRPDKSCDGSCAQQPLYRAVGCNSQCCTCQYFTCHNSLGQKQPLNPKDTTCDLGDGARAQTLPGGLPLLDGMFQLSFKFPDLLQIARGFEFNVLLCWKCHCQQPLFKCALSGVSLALRPRWRAVTKPFAMPDSPSAWRLLWLQTPCCSPHNTFQHSHLE